MLYKKITLIATKQKYV